MQDITLKFMKASNVKVLFVKSKLNSGPFGIFDVTVGSERELIIFQKNQNYTSFKSILLISYHSLPYLYLKDESVLVEDQFHVKTADNLVTRT